MNKKSKMLLTGALFAFAAAPAFAEYPDRPVNFVVPFPPGDLEDVLTRMIAEDFETKYGVAAAVVNKPSEGGPFPGAAEVAASPADGYTIGSFVVDVPVVGPEVGVPGLNPDPFEPLGIFLTYPFVIAASKSAPFSTMEELAKYSAEEPQLLGHFGSFLLPTQATFAAAKEMGFEWGGEASSGALDCNSLASGDFDVINTTIQQILPCMDAVNILASITETPIPVAADVPTLQSIAPELNISLWNGLFVHKDTPADVREKIIASAQETMASDRAKELAAQTGAIIYWQDAATSAERISSDIAVSGKINELISE
ncbi:tripartite tricarboxylate transporter substrate binding protein [Epibacterium sp. SM1979]|uniref:Tripartite tricarboxylate transporter substrate binding protein n=1 Tax=Tritonibacter litoralis TaxID=2662264 RepID=A0A843YA57_9RHOB|nr:tripartite tricarboxylate transporter substrate binding protein [Tritonibacter litoralis]MQQ07816.1 tripartite tricarboxylate transporter substrate binding protein [Tritonibacter litoralis]